MTGGKLVAKILKKYGVENIHTLCGGHIMEIYEGCREQGIRVVDWRHEQSAGFAADAEGRLRGIPGVAVATAGPGVMNAVTAVANAWRASSPMILIGGQAPTFLRGKGALQEMDHVSVLKPITKWAVQVPDTKSIPEYLARAFSAALDGVPGPVFLEMPMDILFNPSEDLEALELFWSRPEAPRDIAQKIFELLKASSKPVLLVGSQIAWSKYKKSAKQIIEKIGIPVFTNGLARGVLGKEHKLLFRFARKKALANADLVILAGVPLDFRLDYGRQISPEAKLVRLDLDKNELERNRKGDVSCVCDPLSALAKLAELMEAERWTPQIDGWFEQIESWENERRRKVEEESKSDAVPVNPLRMCAEVEKFIGEKSIVVGDGGDIVGTASYIVKPAFQGAWLDPGPLGTLGVGAPFAIAAKLVHPDHDVWVIFGDGSFGFNGFEYDTAVRHKIGFVGVIGNDAGWTQIKRAQVPMYGHAIATELSYTRYDKVVEGLGGWGRYVERPEELESALSEALSKAREGIPACVNVKIGETDFRKGSISM